MTDLQNLVSLVDKLPTELETTILKLYTLSSQRLSIEMLLIDDITLVSDLYIVLSPFTSSVYDVTG